MMQSWTGSRLLVIDVEDVTHGSVVINADGTVSFSPASNYNGPASFTVRGVRLPQA